MCARVSVCVAQLERYISVKVLKFDVQTGQNVVDDAIRFPRDIIPRFHRARRSDPLGKQYTIPRRYLFSRR